MNRGVESCCATIIKHFRESFFAGFSEHIANFLSENEVNPLVSTGTVSVAARDRRAGEVTTRVF